MKKPVKKNNKKSNNEQKLDIRVLPIIEAIESAASIFNEESRLLEENGPIAIEGMYDLKKEAESKIKVATANAVNSGLSLQPDTAEAMAIEGSLEKLRSAAILNAESLQGAKDALDHVNNLIRRSASDNGSEGMYNRHARKVDARDKTMVGFAASI